MTILLIEDEPFMRMMLSHLLNKNGFEVVEATSGEQACEIYSANAERIAVVVADAILPGLNGPSTIARLREVNPELRFCFITGGETRELLERGPARVFQKPFSHDEFLKTVQELAAEVAE
jgi:CheY-like chemotaxis protein